MLPLQGVTVVSLEQAVAAPFTTRQLADLGARVIKVERTSGGDFARNYDESVHDQSSYFVWLNRSKESLTLDVKSDTGRDILEQLLATADVFVQNLGPGASGRLGLDAASLSERYPRLIVCDISGYGKTGPWSKRKAYDLLVQSETGLVALTGTRDEVAKVGISVADIAAGMYGFTGILAALYHREVSGVVSPVEVSLFEALAEWVSQPAYYTQYSGNPPQRVGAQHATIAPYGPYDTASGTAVVLAIQNEREWAAFCEIVLDDPSLTDDERFARNSARVANREPLNEIINDRLSSMDADRVLGLLDDAKIANARLNSVTDFLAHPVLAERDRWRKVNTPGGPVSTLLPPATLGGVEPRMDAVPALGEHTDAILRELGRSDDDIEALRREGVV